MTLTTDQDLDQAAAIFTALSHPVRLRILMHLAKNGRQTVGKLQVETAADISLPAVSKHLMTLQRVGLIEREITGRQHWIDINLHPLGDVIGNQGALRLIGTIR